ncbi:MoaD/ThiS family protein [Tamlana sp. 2201CG12-4]|uniref:MoaD/ThiS family protein n=1 Tax=Tamlana sp. 2201CG12-4 TaxID=3112582 RepID=UPI002DB5FFE7|nr:MoaD/ThiS family protein [Tamlana sp. 2201CG12-4]MEC3907782.1 MoaD/ThiS family protein [Tamlana sp. 2201CG12-4]
MLVTIKYLGQIAEVTQKETENLEVTDQVISELIDRLHSKYELLKTKDFQIAQNQELVPLDTKITGDEIALLPPFAGG